MDAKQPKRIILWLYDRLAALYPAAFRAKFGAEQREVFLQTLDAGGSPAALLLREVAHLPAVLARCHFAAFRAGGWKTTLQSLATSFLFLLPALAILNRFGVQMSAVLGYALLGVLLLVFLTGLALGVPRWALPYIGAFLSILTLAPFNEIADFIGRRLRLYNVSNYPLLPRLAYGFLWDGIMVAMLIGSVFLLILVLRLLFPTRPRWMPRAWSRPRRWSDVSFLLYGGALFQMVITFDEYRYSDAPMLIAAVLLLTGAVAFLRAPTQPRALAALLAATTLTFLTVGVAKYTLVPLQDWQGWLITHPLATERWHEALSTLAPLVWLTIALLLPAAWKPYIERHA